MNSLIRIGDYGKNKFRAFELSAQRRSQAMSGYLNLRRFVLVGSFSIRRVTHHSHQLNYFLVPFVVHAASKKRYKSTILGLFALYSGRKES